MPSVLVADDVTDNVKLLAYELSDHGYQVLTAYDGPQALEVARNRRPDVVLLDVMMPGMDGIEVCRRLKADPATRIIPVIMISAFDMEQDVIRGLDAGAHDYVTKPFNLPIVVARVRSAARAKADRDLINEMNERLAELATTDGLTGLKNHRYFLETFAVQTSFAARQRMPLSVIMMDVDHFKSFNDGFGHPAGDQVLRTVAVLVRDQLRLQDTVARYGGEEFAVMLPGADEKAASATAERLRAAVESYPWPLRPVTASLGVSSSDVDSHEPELLVEMADKALYEAKWRGRNRVVVFSEFAHSSTPCQVIKSLTQNR